MFLESTQHFDGQSRLSQSVKSKGQRGGSRLTLQHLIITEDMLSLQSGGMAFSHVLTLVIASPGSQLAHAGTSREDTGERSQFRLSQTENMEIRRWTDGPLFCLGQQHGSMWVILSESQDNRKKAFSDRWMTGAQAGVGEGRDGRDTKPSDGKRECDFSGC
ncbi:Ketol-acid reductoisomerase (NADP(+)) [Dissostichus eleginoides]|uniref:Ketol-acid reductoisomerase (NADP(+)) n=1 Tax=Dissostichus eleginoides TaxID=100907 RepID=A0AAD9BNE8_DISEL|nr:Ketol-acid reductoisomerase (NADP(+)) [Dissostichus eleginoides]